MKEALSYASTTTNSAGADTTSTTADSATEGVDLSKLSAEQGGAGSAGAAATDKLDMNGLNRVNVLFSGCSFVTVDGLCDKDAKTTGGHTSFVDHSLSVWHCSV